MGLIALVAGPGLIANAQIDPTLVAHYTFDNASNIGQDTSGNGNNISSVVIAGGCSLVTATTNAEAGSNAVFFANTGLGGTCGSWLQATSSEILSACAGSFSVSLWLKTTDSPGSNTDSAYNGEGIISVFNPNFSGGISNAVVPMALNGSKLGFYTGGSPDDTLHSASSINTGQYVHLVVTRNKVTGLKQIYVNGTLDASDIGATNLFYESPDMQIGFVGGSSRNSGKGIGGEIDDVQIYSIALSGAQVAYLYANPGSNAPVDFNAALGTTNMIWTTDATNGWVPEATNTYTSGFAAQSGTAGGQTSSLQTTVMGPGTLTFWWQAETPSSDTDFALAFYLDDSEESNISNITPWVTSLFPIPPGTHTLTWTAYAGDFASDAGYLARVNFYNGPAPFSIIDPQINGASFQFSFLSQLGFSNAVQYLSTTTDTNWQIYTNVTGDGTVKTIEVPSEGAPGQFFRVLAR